VPASLEIAMRITGHKTEAVYLTRPRWSSLESSSRGKFWAKWRPSAG